MPLANSTHIDDHLDIADPCGDIVPDVSEFDITDRPGFPDNHPENTIADEPMTMSIPDLGEPPEVTYEVITGAMRTGNDLLVDSLGYSYNKKALGKKKSQRPGKTTWRCSVRSKTLTCPATVSQDGEFFVPGARSHVHPALAGTSEKAKVTAKGKVMAADKDNLSKSAGNIVSAAMTEVGAMDHAPNPDYLARAANRQRQKARPDDPKITDLELDMDHIPIDFLQKDVYVDTARHLLFATPHQLTLLGNAKTWYVDGTFRIVRKPFEQLFGIHAFVKGDESNVKQVPLAFVLMTRRTKKDYKKILKALRKVLPDLINIKKMVMDFEIGLWSAVRSLFPAVELQGCAFHWTQAIWRKTQDLGLAVPCMKHRPTQDFIRQVMALTFHPADHIPRMVDALESRAPAGPCLELMAYVSRTWLEGNWSPQDWSVYGQAVQTNNDVEGYHRRINGNASSSHIPFYVLVQLLYRESQHVKLQVRLVKDGKLARYQRRVYRQLQGRLFSLWDKYERHDITTTHLLSTAARIYGPTAITQWSPFPHHPAFPGTYERFR